MKKVILLSLLGLALSAQASDTWTLKGQKYSVDTLQHYHVGPGTTMTVVDLKGPAIQRVWYTVTDLECPDVEIRTISGKNDLRTRVTVPEMVQTYGDDSHVYFAGVNSDLFSGTGPIGSTILQGEIYKTAKISTEWHAAAYDETSGCLYFGSPVIGFGAKLNGVMEYAPSLVNVPRATGECIIYTPRWGKTTETEAGAEGIEIVLRPTNGVINSYGATECVVESAPEINKGNAAIPEGCIVLSSNIKDHIRDLGLMKPGDKYTINQVSFNMRGSGFGVNYILGKVNEMSGGEPLLLEKGEKQKGYATMPFYDTRRPRTAVGTDASHKKMYLLVVDGDAFNSGISDGIDAEDLVDMMLAIGCTDALNFDGGGSSTMYTDAFGVLNRPSDGHLRKVLNGWYLATPKTGDKTLADISFADPHKKLAIGATYTPVIYGYNAAGLLVDTKVTDYTLSAPAGLGTVSADGKTLTVTGNGLFALEATVNGIKTTIAVHAGTGEASVTGVCADGINLVKFYNLQGQEVETPGRGLYIRTINGKSEKIFINK